MRCIWQRDASAAPASEAPMPYSPLSDSAHPVSATWGCGFRVRVRGRVRVRVRVKGRGRIRVRVRVRVGMRVSVSVSVSVRARARVRVRVRGPDAVQPVVGQRAPRERHL